MDNTNIRKVRTLSERLGAIASLASSAEALYNHIRKIPQLGDWNITRETHFEDSPRLQKFLDQVSTPRRLAALHVIKMVSNSILLACPEPKSRKDEILRGTASFVSASIATVLSPAGRYGSDGADQANMVTQYANAISAFSSDRHVKELSIWFVSIQGTLSYAVAGYAKLFGRPWREGDAVKDIVRTRAYGSQKFWKLLSRTPKTARFISYGVVAWECAFALFYLLPEKYSKKLLVSALLFHIANGPIMGLWRFIFAFSAFHPAMHLTAEDRRIPSSAKNLITTTALGASALYIGLGYSARRRSAAIENHYRNQQQMITSSGSVLPFDLDESSGQEVLCVFENGLMGLPEQFHLVRTKLKEAGYSTLTYTRATSSPQKPSRIIEEKEFTTQDASDNLVDLVRYVSNKSNYKKIVLIGHSYAAEIIRNPLESFAHLQIDTCAVLLDPTHPNQFVASKIQHASRVTFSDHVNIMNAFVRLGFGSLILTPEWLLPLPDALRMQGTEVYRDQLLWRGAKNEWQAVLREMHGDIERTIQNSQAVPIAVISAERTTNLDSALKALHQELASWKYLSLTDATHVSMLANKSHAAKCGELIIQLVSDWKNKNTKELADK